jgi:Xaa-Pro dipeptidase
VPGKWKCIFEAGSMRGIIRKRIENVFKGIHSSRSVEAVLVYNRENLDKNFLYMTGLDAGVFENCGLLFEQSGKMYIFATALEEEILQTLKNCFEIVVFKDKKERDDKLTSVLSQYETVGISFDSVSHSLYLHLDELLGSIELIDITNAFKNARMIKSPVEIEKIQKACDIASSVADDFPGYLKRGVTELDLKVEIDYQVRRRGAQDAAFQTIVAFGANASKPHYTGGNIPLKEGDVVLIDFGAVYDGYVSDISRTYLTGVPGNDVLKLYTTVTEAQEIALGMIADGVQVDKVEKAVRRFIDKHDTYKGRFIHSLGHSIGLEVHDNSYPQEDFQKSFAVNMVLTVEPGIYLPGIGGVRIEDDIVVEKDTCRILTTASKEAVAYEV